MNINDGSGVGTDDDVVVVTRLYIVAAAPCSTPS